jgi:UDP-glucose 4-epimerase
MVQPISENTAIESVNPYGKSKAVAEQLITNYCNQGVAAITFRYFNVAGAHPSRIIGENPINNTDNLFPSIFKSLKLKSKPLKIFGNNYLTRDGTPVRDYVHVMDIAKAHLNAINFLEKNRGFYEEN